MVSSRTEISTARKWTTEIQPTGMEKTLPRRKSFQSRMGKQKTRRIFVQRSPLLPTGISIRFPIFPGAAEGRGEVLKSKKKVRRGRGKIKYSNKQFVIFGNNCAGLGNKKHSLSSIINKVLPAAICLQETKLYRKGTVKIPNYVIFEKVRKFCQGGGLLTAIRESLSPVQLDEDDSYSDLLTVSVQINNQSVHIINGYGQQEDADFDDRMEFFVKFETALENAHSAGAHVCVQMDANSKFGGYLIKGDPCDMTGNGRILLEIL